MSAEGRPTLSGKSVLVTGGAGFIGSHLVDRLVAERPSNLVVVDNMFLGKEANLKDAFRALPTLKLYREDASDFDAMARIVKAESTEVVFDLAVIPLPTSLERPRWVVEVNVGIASSVCELLRLGRFDTLIHFSSSEVYGTAQYTPMDESHPLLPLTPYAASKAAADHVVLSYIHTFGVDAAILRPFNTFGPRQNDQAYAGIIPRVVEKARSGQPAEIYGDGEQTRDYTYVTNVADAAIRLFGSPGARGRVVNVASGAEISVNELVEGLNSLLGDAAGASHVDPRPGDVRRHLGSAELLKQLTGWQPAVPLSEGLERTVAWYTASAASPA
ncbi:MAG TPA: GDP-mannose 4,6-dehydratase [Actinomycetota bacterium]|nr:GDP-mannose 4,6-dehydratase [Actinomycetota bacterium]